MMFTENTNEHATIELWRGHMAAGRMAADIGSYLQAGRQFALAKEIAEELNEPSIMAATLRGLSRAYGGQGRNKESEQLLRQAIDLNQQELPSTSVEIAADRLQLAALLRETGRISESEAEVFQAAKSIEDNDDAPTELRAALMRQLAIDYLETNRTKECEKLVDEAIELVLDDRDMGRHCLAYGQLLIVKVLLLIDAKEFEKAKLLYEEAMQSLDLHRGTLHPRNADLSQVLARHLAKAGAPNGLWV